MIPGFVFSGLFMTASGFHTHSTAGVITIGPSNLSVLETNGISINRKVERWYQTCQREGEEGE
jgi:hypothetical protein